MAADNPTPPEGSRSAANSGYDGEAPPQIELEPGDVIEGTVLDIRSGEGQFGPWHRLRMKLAEPVQDHEPGEVVDYFAEDEAKAGVTKENIEQGSEVWIAKNTVEEESDIDGESVSYYPVQACLLDGGA
jgi:hypothetical protein